MKILEPGFEISTDISQRLLVVTLHGFWQPETMERYWAALVAATRPMQDAGLIDCLLDASDFPVQAQDLLARYKKLSESAGKNLRRVALLTPSSLSRRQLSRMVPDNGTQLFQSREEALAWLEKE